MMPLTVLSRMKNESLLLPDFLNHISKFADEIYIFDDASTDNSVEICEAHPKVKEVLKNDFWSPRQDIIQTLQRKFLFDYVKMKTKNEWFCYIEPDERIEFDFNFKDADGIEMKLYDFYMTPKDKEPYKGGDLTKLRKWCGPEYRKILFFFKKHKVYYPSDRAAFRCPIMEGKTELRGFVKHYGKCLSEAHFKETREHYIKNVPQLSEKWKKRKTAIHTKSDFLNPLIKWQEKEKKGFLLLQ